ncbi:unnamed protein product [Bursaphelenchus xylophilus]|uniref:(pine wood nematode) hypothetical protein n=1 Tax=Bursaphelenchus xylophilus TaxID=6326 RepID=A0A1I7SE25_BURXY|nr:unnamed protein product [Bursaphelenchus xylophilus]CAG9113153.1 unnamed protein product [Bursaphelenchus xylophilus]
MFQQRDSNAINEEELEKTIAEIRSEIDHFKTDSTFLQVLEQRIFYLSSRSGRRNLPLVVLVHDQINNSSIWSENDTLRTLSSNDFNFVALDLPGHGQSTGPSLENAEKSESFAQFLQIICSEFGQENIVVCGASMAGQYIVPLLNLPAVRGVNIKGLIAIALSDAEALNLSKPLPKTLLVRGELDTSLGPNSAAVFKRFENCDEKIIENGRHFCHLGSTAVEFNRLLINFLKDL